MERETRKNFFAGSGHSDVISKINHIIHFSNMAIALDGATGSGKSTLINQINLKGDARYITRFSLLDPSGPDYVIEKLVETWSIEIEPMSSISERFNAIYRTLQGVKESGAHVNIVIDNADLLDDDAIEMLVNLKTSARDNVTLIMTGVNLSNRLKNMDIGEPVSNVFSFESIPPFSDDEAVGFMLQRYPSLASLDSQKIKNTMGKGPFYPEDVKRIGAELLHSTDNIVPPERIGATARAADPATTTFNPIKKHLPIIGGVALAALVGTIGVYAFSDNNEETTPTKALSIDEVRERSKQSIENLRKSDMQTIEQERKLNQRLLAEIQSAQSEIDALRQDKMKLEMEMKKAIASLDQKETVIAKQEQALASAEEMNNSSKTEVMAKAAATSLIEQRIEMARETSIETQSTIESLRDNSLKAPRRVPVVEKVERKTVEFARTATNEEPKSLAEMRELKKSPVVDKTEIVLESIQPEPEVASAPLAPNNQAQLSEPVQVAEETAPMAVAKEVKLPLNPAPKSTSNYTVDFPKSNYVIQLIAHKDANAAERWAKKKGSKNLSVVKTTKKGVDYYAVVYGNYASKAEANADVSNVKQALSLKDTWVRSVGSIK